MDREESNAMQASPGLRLLPDEDLVFRFRAGDQDAFSHLYARYRRKVLMTAYRIVRNPDDAQDATQEIFLKLYRALPEWDSTRARLSTWLYRMAANHAIDCWRFQKKRNPKVPPAEGSLSCAVRFTPYSTLALREQLVEIERCIATLPSLQRRFFVLRYFHGMTLEEIAQSEGRSLGTVKGLLYRATRFVRRRVKSARSVSIGDSLRSPRLRGEL
jgi:RNA polymerase sigma-70 factor (ECF subfamily)